MWAQILVCLSVASTLLVEAQGQDGNSTTKLVNSTQGLILGHKSPNYDVFEFLNIPYATAPTGVNKFKAPLPPPSWNDTFDALDRGIICPQLNLATPDPNIQIIEDCLVANVYVPDTNDTNLPVVVLIHGGSYNFGFGAMVSPNVLVNSKKIIAVSFNYRLGIYGFLCLGTEVAPGNAGMKDQIALLRWVRDNIVSFGGNPEDVTIGGCSAGGSSVDTLMLSKMSNGLYHKVISESGCSLSQFAIQMDPLENAKQHAVSLNFTNANNIDALGEFYASLSLDVLTASAAMNVASGRPYVLFQPCVEKDLGGGEEMFLEEAPINIWRKGSYMKVPTLYGYTDKEGMHLAQFLTVFQEEMNTQFWNFLPVDLKFDNEERRNSVGIAARDFYFGGEVNASKVVEFIDFMTDTIFSHSILRAVSLQIEAGNDQVYLYEYGFVKNNSVNSPVLGAAHCEQAAVALGILGDNPSDELLAMSEKMGEIYLNFITTGSPTPQNSSLLESWPVWPSVNATASRSPYYLIRNITEVLSYPIKERAEFWDKVYLENDIRIPVSPSNSAFTIVFNKLWLLSAIVVALTFK
ncbi:venom carboxylesterase-6-like [Ostrinia furnacalis]|uniref:venom carboxylesterase-6-like n=1 Tax=Ostrinia furnacalis TaxID=93504 RepID=UPI00103CE2CC|nr:venom carboxylesterase-6-like [Ostrinia furnacalis]